MAAAGTETNQERPVTTRDGLLLPEIDVLHPIYFEASCYVPLTLSMGMGQNSELLNNAQATTQRTEPRTLPVPASPNRAPRHSDVVPVIASRTSSPCTPAPFPHAGWALAAGRARGLSRVLRRAASMSFTTWSTTRQSFTSNYLLAGHSNHSATISSAKKNNLLIHFVCSENFFKIHNRFLEKMVER